MQNKKIKWLILILMSVLFPFTVVAAKEVQQVETNGTIGFTGVYEPVGVPDPTPPESIVKLSIIETAKPSEQLPKTNNLRNPWLIRVGLFIICFIFLFWKKKQKQNIKLDNKKVGIIK
ncbi:LPXTG cell wall anchor domain-containing protein [Enterococcus mundtii]|uniref:LPXTG cell wall anchor domain-containing protein n=1 Tax=Enterococcus mundtii TaxID=53346 RepID=UPI001377C981|nr:LPXTG cell wall anchor domain-containing protein [Enterococcus mundtii]NBA63572.1 LPXTG cell wall anchor domain-containing protein [Enterococcus mundtii]